MRYFLHDSVALLSLCKARITVIPLPLLQANSWQQTESYSLQKRRDAEKKRNLSKNTKSVFLPHKLFPSLWYDLQSG